MARPNFVGWGGLAPISGLIGANLRHPLQCVREEIDRRRELDGGFMVSTGYPFGLDGLGSDQRSSPRFFRYPKSRR